MKLQRKEGNERVPSGFFRRVVGVLQKRGMAIYGKREKRRIKEKRKKRERRREKREALEIKSEFQQSKQQSSKRKL